MQWLTAMVIALAEVAGFFALWVGRGVLDQPRPPACSPCPHTAGRDTRRPEAGRVTHASTAHGLRPCRHRLYAKEVAP